MDSPTQSAIKPTEQSVIEPMRLRSSMMPMKLQVDDTVPDDPMVTPKLLDECTNDSSDSCP